MRGMSLRPIPSPMVRRVLREPILHFVAIGGLLFLVFGGSADDAPLEQPAARITITEGEIRNLAAVFERTWRRPPSEAELQGLIDDRIDEEVLAREAKALGLDQGDTVIRRRLRQKMEFIASDLAPPPPPGDAELEDFLERNPERFEQPGRLSFAQILLPDAATGGEARTLLARLDETDRPDIASLGAPTLLDAVHHDRTVNEVASLFGAGFAASLERLPQGSWAGPVSSPFGRHLVRIEERHPAVVPPLAEVREAVARELTALRREEARDAFISGLRERYEIRLERLPNDPAAAPAGQ